MDCLSLCLQWTNDEEYGKKFCKVFAGGNRYTKQTFKREVIINYQNLARIGSWKCETLYRLLVLNIPKSRDIKTCVNNFLVFMSKNIR